MNRIYAILVIFLVWILPGVLSKVCFLTLYCADTGSVAGWLSVLWHGLLLDAAIAGYFSIIPGLMLICSLWTTGKWWKWLWNGYFLVTSFASFLAYTSNLGLYAYWGFPLDSTPLLYIKTSPSAAMASMSVWQMVLFPLVMICGTVCLYKIFGALRRQVLAVPAVTVARRIGLSVFLLLVTAAMIIPIRGGFGTGTNHTGNVYFSQDVRLNHAAVNPIFSFLESVMHQEDIAGRYRFMEPDKADSLFAGLTHTALRPDAVKKDYNVVLVCLESFSKYIMTEAGHVSGVTPNLDRYSREGIYFTNFYANSFRTDRALVSVLSGLPAQPTMSVMDMPRISTSLPSIAKSLGKAGYVTHFYYGGDTNYSNMRSYLVGTGFQKITSQYDFPPEQSTGKWGVADGPVFDRVLADIGREAKQGEKPFFKVFMTSSSHEPFDVPGYRKQSSPELNAFSYTDHCLGDFIGKLRRMPCWRNTLVVIVPDHLGAYPPEMDNYRLWRYELPMVMLGGMITEPRRIPVVGSQIDISATVLAMLGRPHDEFLYSKDLMDAAAPHYAFFTFPDAMGMVEGDSFMFYDNTSGQVVAAGGDRSAGLLPKAQAFLQKLYDDLGRADR